jgi:hypothetical protein
MQLTQGKDLQLPDWKDAQAYAPLFQAERAAFAWEWLRRDQRYFDRAIMAPESQCVLSEDEDFEALEWNLHTFEDPRLAVPQARPVWAARRHSWVLEASARPAAPAEEDCLELEPLSAFARLVRSRGTERLLFSDGLRSIRLDLAGSSVASAPARLSYRLAGVRRIERPLLVLRRLHSLVSRRAFSSSLYPPVCRARRLVALLRAFDALRAGATQAEIAAVLLRPHLERHRWRVHSPSLRSQAQRLVQCAARFANGGFWTLLD